MTEKSEQELVDEMSIVLSTMGGDLGDERAVIPALIGARFRSGDVIALMDRAIERARIRNAAADGMGHS